MNEQRKIVFDTLKDLEIEYELIEHPAIYTIAESEKLNLENSDKIVKNLFLCDDRKKRFFLVSLPSSKNINLKDLQDKLSSRRLSFASEERLNLIMGIKKGAVTPLGILNDKEKIVEVVFDNSLKKIDKIGVHPNDNTATVWLTPDNLEKIIIIHGNKITYLNI